MLSRSQIKYLQSLKLKKFRQKYSEFIIEGEKMLREALNEHYPLHKIIAGKQWVKQNEKNFILKHIEILEASEMQMSQVSGLSTPQNVLAVVGMKDDEIDSQNLKSWNLFLSSLQDPGNMGTFIRTADWFEIKNIFCSINCAEIYNPKVVQASMGSIFRINVKYVDEIHFLKNTKMKKYAAVLNGNSIDDIKFPDEGLLVIGNESKGLDKHIIDMCDEKITIPKYGKAESLNAAVAGAIIMAKIKS